jgi:Zn-finger nucleic acid-binding protein
MKCPVCNIPLTLSERQGIEIDFCPQCRGVWLDRGELDKIIERSATYFEKEERDAKDFHRDQKKEEYYKQKHYKRKSFWAELFD